MHHRTSQTLFATALLLATTISATPTPVADAPPSAPSCGYSSDPKYTAVPLAAAIQLNDQLDALNDNPTFDNCFTNDDGSPNRIAATSDGQYYVSLENVGDTPGKKTVGCARAANYLLGLIGSCKGDGGDGPGNEGGSGPEDSVAGCQFVVETDGLMICIGLDSAPDV